MTGGLMAEARRVRQALQTLPGRRDELIVAMYADGMTLQQVADYWGLSKPRTHEIVKTHEAATGEPLMRPVGRPRTTR